MTYAERKLLLELGRLVADKLCPSSPLATTPSHTGIFLGALKMVEAQIEGFAIVEAATRRAVEARS
jgi:hypothetical protein